MNKNIYFEWREPNEYVQFIQNQKPKPSVFVKLIQRILPKANPEMLIQINESGIWSNSGGIKNLIKFEEIINITFRYWNISNRKVRRMDVYYYEDLETMIPDVSNFAIPDDFDIVKLQAFLKNKGIKIEHEKNV
jgi:hypothetical protein